MENNTVSAADAAVQDTCLQRDPLFIPDGSVAEKLQYIEENFCEQFFFWLFRNTVDFALEHGTERFKTELLPVIVRMRKKLPADEESVCVSTLYASVCEIVALAKHGIQRYASISDAAHRTAFFREIGTDLCDMCILYISEAISLYDVLEIVCFFRSVFENSGEVCVRTVARFLEKLNNFSPCVHIYAKIALTEVLLGYGDTHAQLVDAYAREIEQFWEEYRTNEKKRTHMADKLCEMAIFSLSTHGLFTAGECEILKAVLHCVNSPMLLNFGKKFRNIFVEGIRAGKGAYVKECFLIVRDTLETLEKSKKNSVYSTNDGLLIVSKFIRKMFENYDTFPETYDVFADFYVSFLADVKYIFSKSYSRNSFLEKIIVDFLVDQRETEMQIIENLACVFPKIFEKHRKQVFVEYLMMFFEVGADYVASIPLRDVFLREFVRLRALVAQVAPGDVERVDASFRAWALAAVEDKTPLEMFRCYEDFVGLCEFFSGNRAFAAGAVHRMLVGTNIEKTPLYIARYAIEHPEFLALAGPRAAAEAALFFEDERLPHRLRMQIAAYKQDAHKRSSFVTQ